MEWIDANKKSLAELTQAFLSVREKAVTELILMGATLDDLQFEKYRQDNTERLWWPKMHLGYELKEIWEGTHVRFEAEFIQEPPPPTLPKGE